MLEYPFTIDELVDYTIQLQDPGTPENLDIEKLGKNIVEVLRYTEIIEQRLNIYLYDDPD